MNCWLQGALSAAAGLETTKCINYMFRNVLSECFNKRTKCKQTSVASCSYSQLSLARRRRRCV